MKDLTIIDTGYVSIKSIIMYDPGYGTRLFDWEIKNKTNEKNTQKATSKHTKNNETHTLLPPLGEWTSAKTISCMVQNMKPAGSIEKLKAIQNTQKRNKNLKNMMMIRNTPHI